MMTHQAKLAVVLSAVLYALMTPTTALAQAQVSARVDWEESEKPRRVQFQTPVGNTQFADRSTHFLGERRFDDDLYKRLQIMVRYADGSSIPFPVRAQVNARQFNFTIEKPSPSTICNLGFVEGSEPLAQSTDQNVLIATMQTAHTLVSDTANPCPNYLKRRVAKIYFDASCNLAKRTTFFDISPYAIEQVLRVYQGARAYASIEQQVRACEEEVRKLIVQPVAAAMRSSVNGNRIAEYRALNQKVQDLLKQPEWNAAATNTLGMGYFEDLEQEAQAREQPVAPEQSIDMLDVPATVESETLQPVLEPEAISTDEFQDIERFERMEAEQALSEPGGG